MVYYKILKGTTYLILPLFHTNIPLGLSANQLNYGPNNYSSLNASALIPSLERLHVGLLHELPIDMWSFKVFASTREPECNNNAKQSHRHNADVVHGGRCDWQARRHADKHTQHYNPQNRESIAHIPKPPKVEISGRKMLISALEEKDSLRHRVRDVEEKYSRRNDGVESSSRG